MARQGCRTRERMQTGQALALAVILVAAVMVVFTQFFFVGQVVASKTEHTHALDTATYSGALVQARALNTLGFLNRAQIGHHVAMAHLVTLGSWASLAGTQAQQLARGNPPGYLIDMLFGGGHGQAYRAASQAVGFDQLSRSQGSLALAYKAHDRWVNEVFTNAQQALAASVPNARRQMMLNLLAQSLSDAQSRWTPHELDAGLEINDDQWPTFLRSYAGTHLRPFVLGMAQRYQFLAPRNATARNNWVVDARCPGRRHELRRRGQTQMDEQGRWQASDTESFHALRSNRWIGCYFREYPMGWGWIPTHRSQGPNARYTEAPPENFSAQDFWRWAQEHTTWDIKESTDNPLAMSYGVARGDRWSGRGLPAFLGLETDGVAAAGFQATLRLTGPEGVLISTHSAAEAFFQRPQARADGKVEQANLFRPYWQARLTTPPHARQSTLH